MKYIGIIIWCLMLILVGCEPHHIPKEQVSERDYIYFSNGDKLLYRVVKIDGHEYYACTSCTEGYIVLCPKIESK